MIVLRVLSWILTRENIYGAVADSGGLFAARGRKLRLLNRVCRQPIWVLLSSLDEAESESLLKRLS
jgi:hypothetical protein